MTDQFTLPLLQAISDWQIGSSLKRGLALKKASAHLPIEYRSCLLVCFRQLRLEKNYVWHLIGDDNLVEKISSWTCSIEVAKGFKHGVPAQGSGYQGTIFSLFPPAGRVVINLRTLYREPSFVAAMRENADKIKNFAKGAGKYWDSQCEVVIEIDAVQQEDVFSFGGHSSSLEDLVQMAGQAMYGRPPTPAEEQALLLRAENSNAKIGPDWITPEATKRVLIKLKPQAEELGRIKKLQALAGELRNAALVIRTAIEAIKEEGLLPPSLANFPNGSALDTALLLRQLIGERIELPMRVVRAVNTESAGGTSHAWLLVNGLVVDITSDHFSDRPEVYVGPQDGWYESRGDAIEKIEGAWPAKEDVDLTELLERIQQRIQSTSGSANIQ